MEPKTAAFCDALTGETIVRELTPEEIAAFVPPNNDIPGGADEIG